MVNMSVPRCMMGVCGVLGRCSAGEYECTQVNGVCVVY